MHYVAGGWDCFAWGGALWAANLEVCLAGSTRNLHDTPMASPSCLPDSAAFLAQSKTPCFPFVQTFPSCQNMLALWHQMYWLVFGPGCIGLQVTEPRTNQGVAWLEACRLSCMGGRRRAQLPHGETVAGATYSWQQRKLT